jgi:hypothetical protein
MKYDILETSLLAAPYGGVGHKLRHRCFPFPEQDTLPPLKDAAVEYLLFYANIVMMSIVQGSIIIFYALEIFVSVC